MNNSTVDEPISQETSPFADLSLRSLLGVVATGAATGALIFIFGNLLDSYIIGPALCRGASSSACINSEIISFHIASIISALVGVVMLINSAVFRPLLVALAVVISTWQIHSVALSLSWYWLLVLSLVVNILMYVTFTWLLRIYNLALALGLTVGLVAILLLVSHL